MSSSRQPRSLRRTLLVWTIGVTLGSTALGGLFVLFAIGSSARDAPSTENVVRTMLVQVPVGLTMGV